MLLLAASISSSAMAQDPNRVYTTKITKEDIANYETIQAPLLVDKWIASADPVERYWIEVRLSSFNHMDYETTLRLRSLKLERKIFTHDELRIAELEKIVAFYQKYNEVENLAKAQANLDALKKKFNLQ